MEAKNPTVTVLPYKKVISAFKKRFDVQNGNALGYRRGQDPNGELLLQNKPKSIGDGLATTGWCVSASQALLLDPIFQILLQDRGALAKLISIDIKEQYYGKTFSGGQNKWHTAILVQDKLDNINFVIDITCKQFGNAFNDKDIWDFKTWESTFRSATCKHKLTDFDSNTLSYLPVQTSILNKTIASIEIENNLHDIITITDDERKTIADFFLSKINTINNKLILGNINKFDYKYLEKINKLLENLDFVTKKNNYFVMEFETKESALKWVENFIKNDCILQQYILLSDSIEQNCKYFGIKQQAINTESQKNKTYIVFEFENLQGLDVSFITKDISICIPYGIKLIIDIEKDIYNSGKTLDTTVEGISKKTNTINIKCSN